MMIFNSFLFSIVLLEKTAKEISGSYKQIASVFTRDRQNSDLRTGISDISSKQKSVDESKLTRKKLQNSKNPREIPVPARETSFDQEENDLRKSVVTGKIEDDKSSQVAKGDKKLNQRVPSSSFLQPSVKPQDSIEKIIADRKLDKEFPKPAPRSTQSSTKHIPSSAITTLASSSSGSTTSTNATGAKRINNPRQNHGRAVAPPQLPPVLSSSPGSVTRSDNTDHLQPITNDSVSQLVGDDNVVDFSQSPIAQRLLKQSKDYKGS